MTCESSNPEKCCAWFVDALSTFHVFMAKFWGSLSLEEVNCLCREEKGKWGVQKFELLFKATICNILSPDFYLVGSRTGSNTSLRISSVTGGGGVAGGTPQLHILAKFWGNICKRGWGVNGQNFTCGSLEYCLGRQYFRAECKLFHLRLDTWLLNQV